MACSAACSALKPPQQALLHLSPFSSCKFTSILNPFKLHPSLKLTLELTTHVIHSETDHETSRITTPSVNCSENSSGFSSPGRKHSKKYNLAAENAEKLKREGLNSGNRGELSSKSKNGSSSAKKDERSQQRSRNIDGKEVEMGRKGRRSSRNKVHLPESQLRVGLEMCSKRGDVLCAIKLYELAKKEGIQMGKYHYSLLLYLCSSAATSSQQHEESRSGTRSLDLLECNDVNSELSVMENRKLDGVDNGLTVDSSRENQTSVNGFPSKVAELNSDTTFSSSMSLESSPQTVDELVQMIMTSVKTSKVKGQQEGFRVHVGQDVKSFALQKGFEIYEVMRSEKVPMNEATLTSVARMAMSLGDGDMAFSAVKQMKELGINPRLRSYGPALHVFCNRGDVEKAFMVEEHMLENGVNPEEPELEALLRISVEAERSDKVYYLLHKLRTSVRQVSPPTAQLIEKWFCTKTASRVGKRKWDQGLIRKAIENGGGGWHGQGWLGTGKWVVSHTSVGSDGSCKCCGEQLGTIDLDPEETENFAKSVASIAAQREKNSTFQKFQKWLDDYGPYEAVVDGANVGLQGKFRPPKVNAIVNGIRQMLPSKKWPLIVLHNRHVAGKVMRDPSSRALIEKWRTGHALYETPNGSNDDWYWLYAAIKFRCLIVTNDEMRDHLFQLLGNDFFPKWKERHQVHFSFGVGGPVFHMPPPCSVVIQESEKGHWHVPIASDHGSEGERTWLCVTRTNPRTAKKNPTNVSGEVTRRKHNSNVIGQDEPQDTYANLKSVQRSSISPTKSKILQELEAAEVVGNCIIDFQI